MSKFMLCNVLMCCNQLVLCEVVSATHIPSLYRVVLNFVFNQLWVVTLFVAFLVSILRTRSEVLLMARMVCNYELKREDQLRPGDPVPYSYKLAQGVDDFLNSMICRVNMNVK